VVRRRREPWYRFVVAVVRPALVLAARRDWQGQDNLPAEGGVVVVPNHISHIDPLMVAHFLYDLGRPPRFLAKASLFTVPMVGRILRGAGQIPTYRESSDAGSAVRDAVAAVRAGEVVVVYAEGTLTRDPRLWPMTGKTGAARIALTTGAPVLPMAVWGVHQLLPPYAKRPRLFPRKTAYVRLGAPVDLSDLALRPVTDKDEAGALSAETLQIATDRIMDAVTALVAELRHEPAPVDRLDPRTAHLSRTGNAHVEYQLGDPRPGHSR
jgi:1-acyl-sn-glycerol-3-phosphate acyltransferase